MKFKLASHVLFKVNTRSTKVVSFDLDHYFEVRGQFSTLLELLEKGATLEDMSNILTDEKTDMDHEKELVLRKFLDYFSHWGLITNDLIPVHAIEDNLFSPWGSVEKFLFLKIEYDTFSKIKAADD